MIARATSRPTAALFHRGISVRGDGLAVRFVSDPGLCAVQVAYSTPRRLGTAVQRNRVRRRLRVAMREHVAQLNAGSYLVIVYPQAMHMTWGQLVASLDAVMTKVRAVVVNERAVSRPTNASHEAEST